LPVASCTQSVIRCQPGETIVSKCEPQ
jgi:hypothetical protein